MNVACFCGHTFTAIGDLATCPRCHTPAALPQLTSWDERLMQAELDVLTNPDARTAR